ncbi:histidine phosphatase family protein [Shouchella sp. 1P09AA]|uniref:histidine phosphatase family protein n=1 Tax=unclassified Shouchella TaxID=2893065 RepID=UPI0039A2DE02
MHTIYLVRHAHSLYTPDEQGRPLSTKGMNDALEISKHFQSIHVDRFISSPYQRAIQTIEPTAKVKNKSITLEEGFKERKLAKESVVDFEAAIQAVWKDETFAHDGGESNENARTRGINSLWRALDQDKQTETIVISTHGNLLALLLNHFNKRYNYAFWQQLDMPDIYQLTLKEQQMIDCKKVWRKNM